MRPRQARQSWCVRRGSRSPSINAAAYFGGGVLESAGGGVDDESAGGGVVDASGEAAVPGSAVVAPGLVVSLGGRA